MKQSSRSAFTNSSGLTNSPTHQLTKFEGLFLWLGGGVFVAALVFCAYSYLVSWSTPHRSALVIVNQRVLQPRAGWPALAFDTALFGLFAVHHSLLARESVKTRIARVVPERLVRSVYVWTASFLLVAVCAWWAPVGRDVYDVGGWRAYAHAAVQIAGLWLVAGAVRAIDPLELAGIRQHSRPATLQITGPYRWVRHPLYLGWMLAVFGAAHMTADRLLFAAISSLYLVIAIPWEERSLAREFPDAYRAYQQQVRWRVVPYVY